MQIAGELETHEGDELRERERRMRELLAAASRQQAENELYQHSGLHSATEANQGPDGAPWQQTVAPSPHKRRARRSVRKLGDAHGQDGQLDAQYSNR